MMASFFHSITIIKVQGLNPDYATYCVTLGKLFNFSKPQENGENRAYLKVVRIIWDNANNKK